MAYYKAVITYVLLSSALLSKASVTGPILPKIRFIVSVEGKSFFAENDPARTRDEARLYCASLGMRLGAIMSSQQYLALINAYNITNFNGAAEEARLLRQYSWSETNIQPESFINYDTYNGDYSCKNGLTLYIRKGLGHVTGKMFHNPFSRKWGTLCETPEAAYTQVLKNKSVLNT